MRQPEVYNSVVLLALSSLGGSSSEECGKKILM